MISFSASRAARARHGLVLCAVLPVVANAVNIRIVSYNTQDDVGTGGDTGPIPSAVIPYVATVIEGIGQQKYVGDQILQLPDIIAIQEMTSNTVTASPIVNALNTYYGNSNYNYSSYVATTSDGNTYGGGPSGLIYNQTTINLMASVGVGTPLSGTNGEFRQVVRYELQPLVDKGTSSGIFYIYNMHAKSGSAGTSADGSTDGALRNLEAQLVRSDQATLPVNSSILYIGDLNQDGSTETAYQTYTNSSSGAMPGYGIDPANPTPLYNLSWGSKTLGLLTESDTSLRYRDDLQLMTSPVYNDAAGTLDYVSGSLHAFGNNGTTNYQTSINSGSNTSLNDISANGTLTPSTVLAAMNGSIGSDHLPIVADYTIATGPNGVWNGGTSNWSNSTYWSNGIVPNDSTLEVQIDGGKGVGSVVSLDINVSVRDVILDAGDTLQINSGKSFTLAGQIATTINGTFNASGTVQAINIQVNNLGTFTLNNGGKLNLTGTFSNAGTTLLNGSQNWSTGTVFNNAGGSSSFGTDAGTNGSNLTLNVIAGTVAFASTQHVAALNISSGAVATLTGGGQGHRSIFVTPSLSVGGTFDLTNNDLDVQNGNLQAVASLIGRAYNGGTWAGAGITSTAAANDSSHLTAIGVIQNNQSGPALFTGSNPFNGTIPGAGDVLAAYTYYGDANLDGQIDGSDFSLIDNGFLNQLTGWFNGDFNYDGVIDGSDYSLIDNSYNSQAVQMTDAVSTAQIAAGTVPEPSMTSIFAVAITATLGRRGTRRRTK